MYGAIFGDIIGSRFEFDRGGKTKDFELFTNEDCFTDDTAMTIAVGEALLKVGKDASIEKIKKSVIASMREWGRRYPDAGYGGRFYHWLFFQKNTRPYGSYGNGSAMRVSSAGWLYDSLERTREVARATAEVTHNHPEGIKGADCTASVMYLSRTGVDKEEIKEFVLKEFGYDLSESLEELRARHEHIESCQDSLPKALTSFFEGNSYEDVVRNAVSLGGDTDTLGAIAGAMAEAYYGMPVLIMAEGKTFLPEDMIEVLETFDRALGRETDEEPYIDNICIKEAIAMSYEKKTQESALNILGALLDRMANEGEVPAPMIDKNHTMDSFDIENVCVGQTVTVEEELHLVLDVLQDSEGNKWIPLYTDDEEVNKGGATNIRINLPIRDIIESGILDEEVEGIVINPFGQAFNIPKNILEIVMKMFSNKEN